MLFRSEAAKEIDETTRKVIAKIIRSLFEMTLYQTGERRVTELKEKRNAFKKELKAARGPKGKKNKL